ncbi:unnamed protein product [Dracunculus medinensis]|uniref:ATP synthase subunit epsilon, mitochondrial n=1 Tax=Dracunculus medinensis TaxID=318479 RepID=A0A0N4US90_DRAME|nr:unnamed protein product [Dracunculus medinensis]
MSLWRQAGLSYLKYSEIAAQTLRKCVKVSFIHDFKSFCFLIIRITKWVDGKPVGKNS